MRKVLHLHQPSGLAARPIGAIELEQATDTPVGADAGFHGVIFLGAGLTQLLADLQHPAGGIAGKVFAQQVGHGILPQIGQLLAGLLFQPARQLRNAVGVLQAADLLCLRDQLRFDGLTEADRAVGQFHIHGDTAQVDQLIQLPLPLHIVRH